ncbi:hypothetical protein F5Y14DRAFT_446778 [Nemania sp. NC0429]|nr:hypothetical protein F5Y14DRAFT_446778 [Nemania sp. NC0429]
MEIQCSPPDFLPAPCSELPAHVYAADDVSETEQIQPMERFCIAATRDQFSHETAPPSSSPLPQQPARSPTLSPDPDDGKAYEIQCYHELVDDGGRPPVTLELLDDIYLHTAQYVGRVEPWLAGGPVSSADDLGMYSRPLARWRQFRRWQRENRGGGAPEDTLSAFRERK